LLAVKERSIARSRAVYVERMAMMDAVDGATVASLPVGEAFRARFGNPYAAHGGGAHCHVYHQRQPFG
jgi:salicylate hydroxylase